MATTILPQYVLNRSGLTPVSVHEATDGSGDGVVSQADKADGAQHVKPVASVAGATATPVVGVPAVCPEILTQGIDPALPALLAQWVPLQPGVTLTVTLGAGPVVAAAVGQAVTISALVVGVTTVGAVQAAIAAAPAVVPLLRLDGTPGDVFGATYAGLLVTPLFMSRTATAGGWFGFCADGTWRPVRLLADGSIEVSVTVADTLTVVQPTAANLNATVVGGAGAALATEATLGNVQTAVQLIDDAAAVHDAVTGTTGLRQAAVAYADPAALPADVSADGDNVRLAASRKGEVYVYPSRNISGERATATAIGADSIRTREEGTPGSGGTIVATGTLHNAACQGAIIHLSETGGANPVTLVLLDGGAGGTVRGVTVYCAAGQFREVRMPIGWGTDIHATLGGAGTPSCYAMVNV